MADDKLDHVPGLTSIGYICFDDKDFIITALTRSGDLLKESLPKNHVDRVQPAFDDEPQYLDMEWTQSQTLGN